MDCGSHPRVSDSAGLGQGLKPAFPSPPRDTDIAGSEVWGTTKLGACLNKGRNVLSKKNGLDPFGVHIIKMLPGERPIEGLGLGSCNQVSNSPNP